MAALEPATRLGHTLGGETADIPTAYTTAAARTALETMTALRQVAGKTKEVQPLNAAIDAVIAEARAILDASAAEEQEMRAKRPEQVAWRFGRSYGPAHPMWLSDRYSAQQSHGDRQQTCLAHLARDVAYAPDAGDETVALRLKLWPDPPSRWRTPSPAQRL